MKIWDIRGLKDIFRATRMSRERTRPEAHTTKGLALHRHRIARHFLGCRESKPPGGCCNRRAKCRYGKRFRRLPEGSRRRQLLYTLVFENDFLDRPVGRFIGIGVEVGSIGIDAEFDVLLPNRIERLDDDLGDGTELLVFTEQFALFFAGRELDAESEADGVSGFEDSFEFLKCESVVVYLHCFEY